MGCPPFLSKSIDKEKLYLYLTVSKKVASATLVREEEKVQWPVLEKLALALVIVSRKLRPCFHMHSIEVLTNYPLRQVLQKIEASGRLLKWAIELGQFNVNYHPQMTIKG